MQAADDAPHPSDAPASPPRGCVLVVDDEPATRYATVRTLRHAGFDTLEAADGSEALALAAPFDAVVLDVRLPDIDGFEVCRRLRAREGLAGLPVLHLSAAHVRDHDRVAGLRSGADAYLTHPVEPALIVATLEALLRTQGVHETLRQAEQARYEAREDARDLFMGVLSHDLRNPLNAMLMGAHALLLREDMPPSALKVCARIVNSGRRMRRMLDDLHDFARSRLGAAMPLQRTALRLDALAADVLEELRASHPQADFVLQAQGDLQGEWDADRLARLLSNLLRNAVQYGAPGTPVTTTLADAGERVVLSVHNHGEPIAPAQAPLVFEPMVRAAPPDAGRTATDNLGLGLFICRQIAQAHGGEIVLAASDAGGTVFSVTLPRRG